MIIYADTRRDLRSTQGARRMRRIVELRSPVDPAFLELLSHRHLPFLLRVVIFLPNFAIFCLHHKRQSINQSPNHVVVL